MRMVIGWDRQRTCMRPRTESPHAIRVTTGGRLSAELSELRRHLVVVPEHRTDSRDVDEFHVLSVLFVWAMHSGIGVYAHRRG